MSMNKHQGFLILELAIALLFTSISFCLLALSLGCFSNTYITSTNLLKMLNGAQLITNRIALDGLNSKRVACSFTTISPAYPVQSFLPSPPSYRMVTAQLPWKDSMNEEHAFVLTCGCRS